MASFLAPESPFDPPPLLHTILTQPIKTIVRFTHLAFSSLRSKPLRRNPRAIRVVCISDTHTLKTSLPEGDILIHAGDLTNTGTPREIQAQIDWLDSQSHRYKIAIAGNHDTWLDARSRETLQDSDRAGSLDWRSVLYLQHSSVTLRFPPDAEHGNSNRRIKVFGAPQIPACGGDDFAFQYERGSDAWSDTVPDDTEVLITHTPPKTHLDLPAALGCEYLLAECWRVRPKLHVFGHVHAGKTDFFGRMYSGRDLVRWEKAQKALERALCRKSGFAREVFDPRCWLDVLKSFWHELGGLLWDRVWGGESSETLMVNAALMYNSTNELGNQPQVVEI